MSPAKTTFDAALWNLPPLILHPFNERVAPTALLENSKAALMLAGLIPADGTDRDDLKQRLLSGRYAEMRMLFFLGKDVFRWLDQCVDWAERVPELNGGDIQPQSFAELLTKSPPEAVKEKLLRWGVADYASIFSRSIGMNAVFVEPPMFDSLSEDFLRNYHRFADYLHRCYMDSQSFKVLHPAQFQFMLYASGEYSRLLESQWETP